MKGLGRYSIDMVLSGLVEKSSLEIQIDGVKQSEVAIKPQINGRLKVKAGNVNLEPGIHRLRLRVASGQLAFESLELYEIHMELVNISESLASGLIHNWSYYGQPEWVSTDKGYSTTSNGNAFVVLGDDTWTDYCIEADLLLDSNVLLGTGGAGLLLRVTNPSYYDRQSKDSMMGYYLVVQQNRISLKKLNYSSQLLTTTEAHFESSKSYRFKVEALGNLLTVYVDDMRYPITEYMDVNTYMHGSVGLRTAQAGVFFNNLRISTLNISR